jgi:hypothetical protein
MEATNATTIAAATNRGLITVDVRTLPRLIEFTETGDSPGMLLVPASRSIRTTTEGLLSAWTAFAAAGMSEPKLWRRKAGPTLAPPAASSSPSP